LFTKLEDGYSSLAVYPAGRTDLSYTVPASVQYVEWNAFCGNGYLQTLTISEGVQGLQNGALQNCTALQTVQLPATLQYIASSNFTGCTSLTSVQYAGLESMWSNVSVDEDNDQLPKLPQCADRFTASGTADGGTAWSFDSATGILALSGGKMDLLSEAPWSTFADLVKTVTVDKDVEVLIYGDLQDLVNLEAFIVDENNPNYCSVDGVLYEKYSSSDMGTMALLYYPMAKKDESFVVADGTAEILSWSCSGNPWLQNVVLPEGVVFI